MWSVAVLAIGVLGTYSIALEGRSIRRIDRIQRDTKAWKFAHANLTSPENCTHPCSCEGDIRNCDECFECPRELGEPCGTHSPCNSRKGLVCRHRHEDSDGICEESVSGLPCQVFNTTYRHGEMFTLDCRTQCTCQNGTYGCSSLCPQERISPQGTCKHPRLVELPGQCCREWMCDSQTEQPPICQPTYTKWSSCSNTCGAGLSTRRSNVNSKCEMSSETRICQVRRCDEVAPQVLQLKGDHHIRRGHECKATHRLGHSVSLSFGPCVSRKRFRPKFCGVCSLDDVRCEPLLSTTVKVEFFCRGPSAQNFTDQLLSEILPEYVDPEENLWSYSGESSGGRRNNRGETRVLNVFVQWVLKCRCRKVQDMREDAEPTTSTGEVILHRVHRTAAP